jgi:hypothetical protein
MGVFVRVQDFCKLDRTLQQEWGRPAIEGFLQYEDALILNGL